MFDSYWEILFGTPWFSARDKTGRPSFRTLPIEPFLHLLRRRLSPFSFCAPMVLRPVIVSAYADDVSVFIASDCGFNILMRYTLELRIPY